MDTQSHLVNLGWYQGKALYYDRDLEQLKISSILKDSKKIQTYTPFFSLGVGAIVRSVARSITVDSFEARMVVLVLTVLITALLGKMTVAIMRRKASFKKIRLEKDAGRDFVKEAKSHYRLIRGAQIIFLVILYFSAKSFLGNAETSTIVVIGLIICGLALVHYDYQMSKRRKILRQLQEEYRFSKQK